MAIIKYKLVDIEKIYVETPVKHDNMYEGKITYNGNDFNIQTPVVTVNDTNVTFGLVNKGQLFSVLEEIHDRLIDILYKKSKKFFNNIEFNEARFRSSFEKIASIDDNGVVNISNIKLDSNIKIYDNFKEDLDNVVFPVDAVCIINFDKLLFKRKTIILVLSITHMKVDYKTMKKKLPICILDDSDKEREEKERLEREEKERLEREIQEKETQEREREEKEEREELERRETERLEALEREEQDIQEAQMSAEQEDQDYDFFSDIE